MTPTCLLLLASLGADASPTIDAGVPLWAPRLKPVDVSDEATYPLRRYGKGYFFENSKFEAQVSHDGIVTFKDKHVSLSSFPFSKLGKSRNTLPSRDDVRSARDPSANRRTPWIDPVKDAPMSTREMDQELICPPNSSCYAQRLTNPVSVTGSFDLTDEIMRALGQDPYALDKAHFLSATFEFRIKLAIEARKEYMRKALDKLPERLEELWGDHRYTARERRRILYELWFETDITPEAGRVVRMIENFIRRRLPCEGADAYTPGEIEAFGKSHPERRFVPGEDCGKKQKPGMPETP
jgi:hypothetical protein